MTEHTTNPTVAPTGHAEHPPHLAHHFETPEQQYQSGKLGMWMFLATEILMFGGLFCAYAVYRHNHPDVFRYAHTYLDKNLGAINTAVLIASSLSMAWAVRLAQLGKKRGLMLCLSLTLAGGLGFMGIKAVEYAAKWRHHIFIGSANIYRPDRPSRLEAVVPQPAIPLLQPPAAVSAPLKRADPNAGTPDEPRIKPPPAGPSGLAGARVPAHEIQYGDLAKQDRQRVYSFFGVYFAMTGLHGLHVLIGMGLITWILIRSARGEFGPLYFAPVDLVGLYWHLVDLIWIFLFPLLYLIH